MEKKKWNFSVNLNFFLLFWTNKSSNAVQIVYLHKTPESPRFLLAYTVNISLPVKIKKNPIQTQPDKTKPQACFFFFLTLFFLAQPPPQNKNKTWNLSYLVKLNL